MSKITPPIKRKDSSQSDSEGKAPVQSKTGTLSGGVLTSPSKMPVGAGSHPTPHHPAPPNPAHMMTRTAPSAWFTVDIQQMMHGLGDCRKPLLESATIIEQIVHHELTTLLYQAEDIARQRSARFIGIEDFLFLLRRDKVKLRRLLRYMELKDNKAGVFKGAADDEEGGEQGSGEPTRKKRRKICYDFLSAIDQSGELVALMEDNGQDDVKLERALRAELLTRQMDVQQYMEYCEARQASFTPKYKSQRFKDWLLQGVNLDVKPNPLAVEVLCYLAYETVAQIVDLTLLVKRDMRATAGDPFSQVMPPVCINHDSLPAFQSSAQNLQSSNLKSPSRSTSPATSPPSTPTTPTPTPTGSGATTPTSQMPPGSGGSSSKSKSKKKKKSGSSQPRDIYTSQAIQPCDIREAMRRYEQSVGPFADFSKSPMVSPRQTLLCS